MKTRSVSRAPPVFQTPLAGLKAIHVTEHSFGLEQIDLGHFVAAESHGFADALEHHYLPRLPVQCRLLGEIIRRLINRSPPESRWSGRDSCFQYFDRFNRWQDLIDLHWRSVDRVVGQR